MNWRHLQAFAWLRWRLLANQWRRAGAVNAALMIVVSVGALASMVPLLIGCFAAGVYLIPRAEPAHLMYAWDGLVLAFSFFWMIGLITELQKSDPLTLSRFLHLPVSVRGAFLLNYLSSLLRISLLFFGPIMLAYALALLYVRGVEQWATLPLLAAFLVAITGLTYQFQGWLALMMNNPRRRRAVIMGSTMGIILLAQVPNLINMAVMGRAGRPHAAAGGEEFGKIQAALKAGEIAPEEAARRMNQASEAFAANIKRDRAEERERIEGTIRWGNAVVPLGWLPLGVAASAEGRPLPAFLGLAGLAAIGAASLGRAYRTTIAAYTGHATNRKGKAPAARAAEGPARRRDLLVEARIPGLAEPVAVIALAGLRGLIRAPEVKLALISPIILGGIFGSTLYRTGGAFPVAYRGLLGAGAIAVVLFGLLQVMGNQFGLDRDGFRAFVLSAARRRDILLGKNLTFAPVALVLSVALLAGVQFLAPMRWDHALAMAPQFVSMFLMFCLLANLFSIYAPMAIAAGTLKPAHPKFLTVLIQLAFFLLLFPLGQGLTLIPIGVEAGLTALDRAPAGLPIYLLLALVEAATIAVLYHFSLIWLGSQLHAREQKILETITNRG